MITKTVQDNEKTELSYKLFKCLKNSIASVYKNEESVGKAIAKCGVPRKDLFITSKSKEY